MGVIIRPDDMRSIMAGVYARLEALERTDSAYLTSVMQPIGTCHPSGALSGTSIMEFPTDGHASFSVSRPTSVLALCSFALHYSASSGSLYCGLGVDSTTSFYSDSPTQPAVAYGAVDSSTPMTLFAVAQVAAGAHSVSLLGQILNPGGLPNIYAPAPGLMKVFRLG